MTCTRPGPVPVTTRSTCARRSSRCTNAATTSTSSPILRPVSASPATTTRPRTAWLRELTKDAVDDFDAFAENGVARFAAARRCRGLCRRDPRPRAPQVHDTIRQNRDLLDGARRQARPLWSRAYPGHPDVEPAIRGEHTHIRSSCARRNRAPAPTRFTTTSRSWRGSIATMSGSIPRTHVRAGSWTASACASSMIAAPRCCPRASPIASRAAPYRSRKEPGSRLTLPERTPRDAPTCLPMTARHLAVQPPTIPTRWKWRLRRAASGPPRHGA